MIHNSAVIKNQFVQDSFESYLRNHCKLSDSTVQSYLSNLRTATKILNDSKIITGSIYDISPKNLHRVINDLCCNDLFIEKNIKSRFHYTQAINHYNDFTNLVSNLCK